MDEEYQVEEPTLRERISARALGVDVDADPGEIQRGFRLAAKAIHPDHRTADGAPDLGRLAEARATLLARYERLVAARAETLEADASSATTGDDGRRPESEEQRVARTRRFKEQAERLMRQESAAYRAERDRIRVLAEQNRQRWEARDERRRRATEAMVERLLEKDAPSTPSTENRDRISRRDTRLIETAQEVRAREAVRAQENRAAARRRAATGRSSVAKRVVNVTTIERNEAPVKAPVPQPDAGLGTAVDLAG